MTLPNPTKLPRYIIRRMFNQRSKATGTFKNYVNACVAGPGLKQKHLNSYRLSHQRNLMYFLEHKNEHLWNPARICSPFLVKPPWGSAKLLFWEIGRVRANNRKKIENLLTLVWISTVKEYNKNKHSDKEVDHVDFLCCFWLQK